MRFSCAFLFSLICLFAAENQISAQSNATHIFDPELNKLVVRQEPKIKSRELRYMPDGEDFVIINGKKKFNRALYGTNTGFRVETGDVPEFALYLPRMGGNLAFSLSNGTQEIELNKAKFIGSRYRAGSVIYTITDPILGKGKIQLTVLALSPGEGLIIRIITEKIPAGIHLKWRFGGASDKRFSREGDLGVDPQDSFELKPEYCKGNEYNLDKNTFELVFGAKKDRKLMGIFPENAVLSIDQSLPVLQGEMPLTSKNISFLAIKVPDNQEKLSYNSLSDFFEKAEEARVKIASSLKITTPDPFFNTLGGTISVAADGIWDGKVWMHGAIGWRMPLNGWRAAYTGDVMGWHDRARTHFDAYAASQVTDVPPVIPHPAQDSALNLARALKAWGTPMYSNGYICRNPERNDQMHHYDMNLAYIDELLWHFNWTGDKEYVRKMWPVLTSHLAWEKRNFDPDGDGLYNAYCCIWASDALYYNSGGVTHATAYNYRVNKMAAEIAELLGENPEPYKIESRKILKALNTKLWLPRKGHWAEFVDFMGEKIVHESAAIWTVYHAIDSEIHDAFQAYQATRYVDQEIPHIAVEAKGIEPGKYQVVSTTNWLPYSWSINNVAVAETNHLALAYFQAGRTEKAFNLLKSSILDNMYLGSSPGNVGQISYYDAARGECYRDFGDPVGITSRAIVQGLFGILPDAMHEKLLLKPGFPAAWNHASIETATIAFSFKKNKNRTVYTVKQHFTTLLETELVVPVSRDQIKSVKVNGKPAKWSLAPEANGIPMIAVKADPSESLKIEIVESGEPIKNEVISSKIKCRSSFQYNAPVELMQVIDPQGILTKLDIRDSYVKGVISALPGHRTLFVKLRQGQMTWIQPIHLEVFDEEKESPKAFSQVVADKCEIVPLGAFFNDSVSKVFKNKYLSPRSPYTTLQIPTQGIGEWCHPTMTADIDDSGLRKKAVNNRLQSPFGFVFETPATGNNVVFTSQWDNFPVSVDIPVYGSASNAYLMLAGTTSHMQCHLDNGYVIAHYTDGSADTLRLVNPENWCPIEQDFYVDEVAFKLKSPRPYRIHLKTGLISNDLEKDLKIGGVYGRKIDGGAGVLLDMPLNKSKTLRKITVQSRVNEVIIGLMAITLQR